MNCHEFEDLVVDLARGVVADSSVGTRCWAHAANCHRCADRLLDQEKLTAGFEALTARTIAMPVPEKVEALLRREFRSHFAKNEERIAIRPFSWDNSVFSWMSHGRWAWAGAAAVLLLSLAGFLAVRYRTKLPLVTTAQVPAEPKGPESQKTIERHGTSMTTASQEYTAVRGSKESSVLKSQKPAGKKNDLATPARPKYRSIAHDDLATNFYPLPYGSGLPLDEGWEIVRVSMPRSALANLGVPLAGDQGSTESIRADLVLGEDGLARAIRFVE